MYTHETRLRVRYSETDRMGYVYYGNYAEYLEVARVEMLRNAGIAYRALEEEGVMLPVRELRIVYHKPVRYDDEITVRTELRVLPTVRIVFHYAVLHADGSVLSEAETTLVFVDAATGRPRTAPQHVLAALVEKFEQG
ncbi:MAG: acyl-CoA thioesterase [Flavobacteriales bacterium]|nr:MAG: acyl-CoA thioesterase [Flavobacteriales bacterium]